MMNFVICSIIVMCGILYNMWLVFVPTNYNLIVGVLSAREHFLQRNIIREGLKRQQNNATHKTVFIVASQACKIPVELRRNPYTCESMLMENETDQTIVTVDVHVPPDIETFVPVGPVGLDFQIFDDLVVTEIGVYDHERDGLIMDSLQVSIFDIVLRQPVVSTAFVSFNPGKLKGFYRFKTIQPVLLKCGFKGSIVIEGVTEKNPLFVGRTCTYSDNNFLHFSHGYRYGFKQGVFPSYLVQNTKSPCFLSGLALSFSVLHNSSHNGKNESLLNKWLDEKNEEEQLLRVEQSLYNDLVIVDGVETYRNLPKKMIEFYSWLSLVDFDFFLKTDDDTFVYLPPISNYLDNLKLYYHLNNAWIGNFREHFPLDMYGKWSEHEYKSVTYPPFACGSGYILSKNIVKWIATNRNYLKTYQGEDTSLGIWLAAISIDRIHHNGFQCTALNENNIFTSPQHNVSELETMYGLVNRKF